MTAPAYRYGALQEGQFSGPWASGRLTLGFWVEFLVGEG
jgi:hypothetical protein